MIIGNTRTFTLEGGKLQIHITHWPVKGEWAVAFEKNSHIFMQRCPSKLDAFRAARSDYQLVMHTVTTMVYEYEGQYLTQRQLRRIKPHWFEKPVSEDEIDLEEAI